MIIGLGVKCIYLLLIKNFNSKIGWHCKIRPQAGGCLKKAFLGGRVEEPRRRSLSSGIGTAEWTQRVYTAGSFGTSDG